MRAGREGNANRNANKVLKGDELSNKEGLIFGFFLVLPLFLFPFLMCLSPPRSPLPSRGKSKLRGRGGEREKT